MEKNGTAKRRLSRRQALTLLLGAGGAVALGCGSSAEESGEESLDGGLDGGLAGDGDGGDAGSSNCEVSPEGEVGPYFADDSDSRFNRSNILSNLDGSSTQAGIPLTLNISVLDAQRGCVPYVGAQVDIWHCNASGVYSDIGSEGTSAEQWLRGYQITDTDGKISFQTLVPGWYSGRTTHIHLRVRSSYSEASATDDETNTTQCFFDQTFVDTLASSVAPYNAEGQNPTTNASDQVYSQQEAGANQLSLAGNQTSGYTTSVTIVLPITTEYRSEGGDGGPGGPGGMMSDGGGMFPGDGGRPPFGGDAG